MNAITTIKGTVAVERRHTSPVIHGGQIGKAIAVAANDLIETYRTPNMTNEQAAATMRSYLRVMQGHAEAVVERALNALIVNNPAGHWMPSPTDLRDAIDQIEWAPLYAMWRQITARANKVAPDVREALREELFDTLRPLSDKLGAAEDDWQRFIARVAAGKIYDRDGNLLQPGSYAAVLQRIVEERRWAERLEDAIEAVRPSVERQFEQHRDLLELIRTEGEDYLRYPHATAADKRDRLKGSKRPAPGTGAVVAVDTAAILDLAWGLVDRDGFGWPASQNLQTDVARLVTARLPSGYLGQLILATAIKAMPDEDRLVFRDHLGDGDR